MDMTRIAMKKIFTSLFLIFSFCFLLKSAKAVEVPVAGVPLESAARQGNTTNPAEFTRISEIKATITKATGTVTVRSRGSLFWHDAKAGDVIGGGTEILTKDNGKIEFTLENGNTIKLKPNSRLLIAKITQNNLTGEYENFFEAKAGRVWAKVAKIHGSSVFRIKTPTGVAGARGTIIYLLVYPDSTQVFFEEGRGFFTDAFAGRTFDVEPGFVYEVGPSGNVSAPVVPSNEQIQNITQGWNINLGGAEGYSPPPDATGGVGNDVNDTTKNNEESNNNAQDDKKGDQGAGVDPNGTGGVINPPEVDTDGDGWLDKDDPNPTTFDNNAPNGDLDGDGILNKNEAPGQENIFNNEGPNGDLDGDGILNKNEAPGQENIFNNEGPNGDLDKDGLTNAQEAALGTNPNKADTDNDGLPDKYEVDNGLNPLVNDAALDKDGDGLTNLQEYQLGTKPNNADTDGDGMPDGYEAENSLNPRNANDASADADGDGLTNLEEYQNHTAVHNADTDKDGISDGLEVHFWHTDPLVADVDNDHDHVPYVEDAFPDSANLDSTDPNVYGSRDSIRKKTKDIIERTAIEEKYILRQDIQAMIDDTNIRELDAKMAQVADAQTGKVLVDRQGYRVRAEQYVLRPDSSTVEVLNITLRTQEAGSLAGLHTLDWTTRFNQPIDSLTGGGLRDLPWDHYLEGSVGTDGRVTGGPNYGSGQPGYYPTEMTLRMDNPSPSSDVFMDMRTFGNLSYTGGMWTQAITEQIYLDGAWRYFRVTTNQSSGTGNPKGFIYNPDVLGSSWDIQAKFYVIGDGQTGLIGKMQGVRFDTIWDALAVNMSNHPNVGDNNLEINLESKFGGNTIRNIDLIYIPWRKQGWNETHTWKDEK